MTFNAHMRNIDILIKDGFLITMDNENKVVHKGAVAIQGNRICDLGPTNKLASKYKAEKVINASHFAVLPGFVNAHTHNGLLRGFGEGLSLQVWLETFIYPMEKICDEKHAYHATMLNQLEMIKSGTTCFLDLTLFEHKIAEVAEKSGLRANLAPVLRDAEFSKGENLQTNERLIREWHKRANDRIRVWVGPDNPFSCSIELYQESTQLADKYDVCVHTHLAETLSDVLDSQKKYGKRPIKLLDDLDFFNRQVHIAHCVWPSDEEVMILKERGVTVSHNPSSNMKLASGVSPIVQLMKNRIAVGLGTDSIICNNNSDMIEEMRRASYLQKVHSLDASLLPASQAIRMATMGSAQCLRLEKEIGSLEVGKKADVILVDLTKPHMTPIFVDPNFAVNVMEQIVYSANGSDVHTTIVDGKILMENYQVETLDEQKVLENAQSAAADLYSKVRTT